MKSWKEYSRFWKKKQFQAQAANGLGNWWEVGGRSGGYWAEIVPARRSQGQREAEAHHNTRFGRHWSVLNAPARPPSRQRSYTTMRSPYDPAPGVGLWNGWTAPPPRIGDAAPARWADTPAGVPPFVVKWYQAVASRVVTDQLSLSNDPHSYQRLRDLKAHIHERRVESGAAFQDVEKQQGQFPCSKYARGTRWAELNEIELYRRYDQLRWCIDAMVDDEKLDFSSRALEHHSIGGETGIIAGTGRGQDSAIAAATGFKFEEVTNTVERRRRRPLRERQKPGRKPIGDKAMTGAERVQRHREKLKLLESPQLSDNSYDTGNGDRAVSQCGTGAVDRGRARASQETS
jgi:hypothetical protein